MELQSYFSKETSGAAVRCFQELCSEIFENVLGTWFVMGNIAGCWFDHILLPSRRSLSYIIQRADFQANV